MAIDYLEKTVVDLVDSWAKNTPNATAVEWKERTLSYANLRDASLHVSKALLSTGIGPGDKVPILSQMSLELLPAILGVLRVGACYVPIDLAAWSKARINGTIDDISPKVAIATSRSDTERVPVIVFFQQEWLDEEFQDTDGTCKKLDAIRQSLDSKALVYVTFTSGTTGKPKGVMIYHHALYKYVSVTSGEAINTMSGERVLLAFSISFDACACTIWTTITRGGALIMASWSTFPEIATTCDSLILTPSMFATMDPTGPYEKVRRITLGAEATNLDIARKWISPTRKVVHTYGPSEATIVISYGRVLENSEPDLGSLNPGVEVVLVDENLQESDIGEILIGGPCLAAGYLNNAELTAKKFIQWNGRRVYRTGDLARKTQNGLSWIGRADRLVKNRGFLINLETEVESGMLRYIDVRAASAFVWRGKLMGFVQPATVNVEELRIFMKDNFDHFVVPDEILAMDHFPLTAHGKVDRAALHAELENRMAKEDEDLDNMVVTSRHEVLRWAFAKCLHVPFAGLDGTSSFALLGGNSLAAIRMSNLLRQQGYAMPILHILREDTIGHLEEKLSKLEAPNGTPLNKTTLNGTRLNGTTINNSVQTDVVPATDMHRLMLTQSQRIPMMNALMARAKFSGPSDSVPTPNELHVAWKNALAAHSIFKTRYDMKTWTLHDLDHVNLDWEEFSVEAEEFDHALWSTEEEVWASHRRLESLPDSSLEVPYCHMTCVYTPGRKAIGFVWRIHHVLIDIFSFIILMRDLEQALAHNKVSPGPRIKDYSAFMQKFKAEKLDIATDFWKRMMEPIEKKSLFDFQPPHAPFEGDPWTTLQFSTKETVESIETSVRAYDISSATLIFGAWAFVLAKYTRNDFVPFYLSRSGRMVPWPLAPSLVAAMNCRVPFATSLPAEVTVQEWLGNMHGTLLNVAELENLCQSLDTSIYPQEYFKTGVQAFLYMPESPTSWTVYDRLTGQPEPVGMVWRVQPTGDGGVETELEIDQRVVDVAWAKEVGHVAVSMLERLTNAQGSTKLRDLNLY